MRKFDVAIVGAGPAGLFAALALAEESAKNKVSIIVIDRGPRISARKCPLKITGKCASCTSCAILEGVGGAGAFSSGIINIRPDVGGDLDKLIGSWSQALQLVELVDKVFVYFGGSGVLFEPSPEKVVELERKAVKAGGKLIPVKQRLVGTDNMIKVVGSMEKFLEDHSVKLLPFTTVLHIEERSGGFTLQTSRGDIEARYVLVAPGRSGALWLAMEARRLGIEVEPGFLDVGVRVEVPYTIMEPLTSIIHDPKIVFHTKTFDDKVRTFCTNPHGYVIKEVYPDGTIGVNGETFMGKGSLNTNFALLATIVLTDPMDDALEYGKSIARIATRLGGGRPLIQRLGDLIAGRRSTWSRIERSVVEPTLRDATPGDIGMALPYRIVTDILEALERLDDMAPGVWSKHTLLYAPEVKYYSLKIKVNAKTMETSIPGLYVAGDGAGLSRGINIAAATGYLAAKSIAEKLGVEARLPLEEETLDTAGQHDPPGLPVSTTLGK